MSTPAQASPKPLAAAAQPARFLIVGAGGFVLNLAIFALLHAAGVAYIVNSIISHPMDTGFFRNAGFWSAYLRYMIVGAVVAGLNVAILVALVQGTGIDSRIGVAISLLLITPVAFVLFKRWTFRIKPA